MSTLHLKVSGGFAIKWNQEVLLKLSVQRSWVGTDMLRVHILRLAGSQLVVTNASKHTPSMKRGYLLTFTTLRNNRDIYIKVNVEFQAGSLLLMKN